MSKSIYLLLFAIVACHTVAAQSQDELQIPVENDNQFPPENHLESNDDVIEGSGAGVIEEPVESSTTTQSPAELEDVDSSSGLLTDDASAQPSDGISCPTPCVCNLEGGTNDFVVNCAGYDMTEFPSPIDSRTTTLNLQNNKLTEIPKSISELKALKVLNVNNNLLMELSAGSISELPELTMLNLGNNRLIEYPRDLKNSFEMMKLEELDLGGNDMRTPLTTEQFSNFKSLRKLILPTSTTELLDELCLSLIDSLEIICTETCENQSYECPDASQAVEDGMLEATLPGAIAFNNIVNENADPTMEPVDENENNDISSTQAPQEQSTADESSPTTVYPASSNNERSLLANEFSLRTAVNNVPEGIAQMNSIVVNPDTQSSSESTIKVGATTSDTKTGGVDKSVIGIIVAGMVLVVAGITIKKNWSSIKKSFSSSPRGATERSGTTANGTAPEEMPLQDKSPV